MAPLPDPDLNTPETASLITELLREAGWLDNAGEILCTMLMDDEPYESVLEKARLIDATITACNALRPGEPPVVATTVATLDRLVNS